MATTTKTVTITNFGLTEQSYDAREVWVQWTWGMMDKTDYFKVIWQYCTSDGVYHSGEEADIQEIPAEYKHSESKYSPPNNSAIAVKVRITPIAKKDKKGTPLFTANESVTKEWSYNNNPPEIPEKPEPTVDIPSSSNKTSSTETKKPQLKVEFINIEGTTTGIEFELREETGDQSSEKITSGKAAKTAKDSVTWTTTIEYGSLYQVRCRAYKTTNSKTFLYSKWSEWSDKVNAPSTAPVLKSVTVTTRNSIEVVWSTVKSAQTYYIEYVAKDPKYNIPMVNYFDAIGIQKQSQTINVKQDNIDTTKPSIKRTIVNLTPGAEYYIRVGSSASATGSNTIRTQWSTPMAFILGMQPEPPTIWASNKIVSQGDPLKLYWMHNPKDSSVQTQAIMEFAYGEYKYDANGNKEFVAIATEPYIYPGTYGDDIVVKSYKSNPDDVADQVYIWEINTNHNKIQNGAALKWRMKTAGVLVDEDGYSYYGDFSEYNIVDIYEKPSLMSNLKDVEGNIIQSAGELTTFPLTVEMGVGDYDNQRPTGYLITIKSNSEEGYEIVNDMGEVEYVSAGSTVYSKYIDTNENNWTEEISAEHLTLANNVEYTVTCSVYMSSGLTAQNTNTFVVAWVESSIVPFATIAIDTDNLSASIRPYTRNEEDDVILSVYRKEYDGSFTEIESNISNGSWVIDPHPALDYARYRIIAKSNVNGSVEYHDIPPIEVGEKSLVIQWDETWDYFYTTDDGETPVYSRVGSMLKLPYNISISHSNNADVSLINYIGRKSPVSYYGTQRGEKASWSTVIEKTDKETLYALRRLSIWMGDVYVREPSGTGYWANISVSYSTNPLDLTVPISINVTRVEGGK